MYPAKPNLRFPEVTYVNKTQKITEKKAAVTYSNIDILGYSYSSKMMWYQVSASMAWKYYKQVSVIYTAIDIIAQLFATITPQIWDSVDKRFLDSEDKNIDAYELLGLLKMPMFGMSYTELAKQMTANYLATGNLFILVSALNDKSRIIEIEIINSQYVTIETVDAKGYPLSYTVSYPEYQVYFYKDAKSGRYYNSRRTKELWHTKIFDPTSNSYGLSPFSPLYFEIEQLIASAIHNGNLLQQGARPSGILTIRPEYDLTDEQYNKIKRDINAFYSNKGNENKIIIAQGGDTFQELSLSNIDMDFLNLKKSSIEQVLNQFKIPLAFLLSDTMTLDNYVHASIVLFDMGVLPITNILFNELSIFLMHRYDDTGRYKIWYNKRDIDAMQSQYVSQLMQIIKTGVLTYNEARDYLNLPPLEDNAGNQILIPANLIPFGVVEKQHQHKLTKKEYEKLLRDNNFNQSQIDKYINKYYKND